MLSFRFITNIRCNNIHCVCACMHAKTCVFVLLVFAMISLRPCIPQRRLGNASAQMLLTPSEHRYSSFVGFPQDVYFILFNQGLDPTLGRLFSPEKGRVAANNVHFYQEYAC